MGIGEESSVKLYTMTKAENSSKHVYVLGTVE